MVLVRITRRRKPSTPRKSRSPTPPPPSSSSDSEGDGRIVFRDLPRVRTRRTKKNKRLQLRTNALKLVWKKSPYYLCSEEHDDDAIFREKCKRLRLCTTLNPEHFPSELYEENSRARTGVEIARMVSTEDRRRACNGVRESEESDLEEDDLDDDFERIVREAATAATLIKREQEDRNPPAGPSIKREEEDPTASSSSSSAPPSSTDDDGLVFADGKDPYDDESASF